MFTRPFYLSVAIIVATMFPVLAASQDQMGTTEEEVLQTVQKLDWKIGEGEHILSAANSYVRTNANEAIVFGSDANKFIQLNEGHDRIDLDAVVIRADGPKYGTSITYKHYDIGHVKMDDWNEKMDPESVLDQIKESTQAANDERAAGYPDAFVDGWLQRPTIDRDKAIVYWAIEGHSSDGVQQVNAKAMKFGRHGVTAITWIGKAQQFQNAAQNLKPALDRYHFEENFQYADFKPDMDKVAALGAGALATKIITGRSGKAAGAGIFAVIAAFGKKLWWLIAVPFIVFFKAIGRGVKSLFQGRND